MIYHFTTTFFQESILASTGSHSLLFWSTQEASPFGLSCSITEGCRALHLSHFWPFLEVLITDLFKDLVPQSCPGADCSIGFFLDLILFQSIASASGKLTWVAILFWLLKFLFSSRILIFSSEGKILALFMKKHQGLSLQPVPVGIFFFKKPSSPILFYSAIRSCF